MSTTNLNTISAERLKQKMEQHPNLLVVNVLDTDAFEAGHIPGSHNIPGGDSEFVAKLETLAGSKTREIVVYCASTECSASPKAAKKLIAAGFTHVIDFEGGMKAWKDAGYEVESGVPAMT